MTTEAHPLSAAIPADLVEAIEMEIATALEKGVSENDPDLIALREALKDITGNKFTRGALRHIPDSAAAAKPHPLDPPEYDGYDGASDTSDSDDNDAPGINDNTSDGKQTQTESIDADDISRNGNENDPAANSEDGSSLQEKQPEAEADASEEENLPPGFYDTEEYAGIFENKVVKIAVRAAESTLKWELRRLPLVHRAEIVDIVNEVFPAAKLHAGCADTPESFVTFVVPHFAKLYAPLLVKPVGTLEPKLSESDDDGQISIRAQLFWRCAVQLHFQPLSSLVSMVKRREEFKSVVSELEACKGPAQRRFTAVRMWLPLFSMMAEAPREPEPEPDDDEVKVEDISSAEAKQAPPPQRIDPTKTAKSHGKAYGEAEYIAAEKFEGSKPGYFFTHGDKGLGYYRDHDPRAPPPDDRTSSAAKHTYDVGYSKWDDVLRDVGSSDDED